MDRVRFGRALGKGARLAARTAMEAVDAATSSPPSAPTQAQPVPQRTPDRKATTRTHSPGLSATLLPQVLLPAARHARAGVAAPLRQASRALWHELTGSFFALFALSFGVGVWHTRANAWSSHPADRYRFAAFCALALLFLYFATSSFARARRRQRA